MGGKKKDAQRTKGNTKPASSGQAALLLEASGGNQTGFVGFDVLRQTSQTSNAADSIDKELHGVMKRMTKRDPVTKLKALEGFKAYCKENRIDENTLKYWPRLYSRLAIDFDHRVREAAHNALKEVACESRESFDCHIQSLMGPWLLSFGDGFPPAASAAKQAFDAVFTSTKQREEAMVRSHDEIIKYVCDMLFTATADSLSDAKTTSANEMQEKYERILASSLRCLGLIISSCPSEKIADLSTKCASIFSKKPFWKFANHSNKSIRSAFFSLIGCVVQRLPSLANENAAKLCPVVLSRLGETDPVVCRSLWDVVEPVTSIEGCWSHVNMEKAVLPGLWSVMKKGFHGNAKYSSVKLCQLLRALPEGHSGSRVTLMTFFNNFSEGLNVHMSTVHKSKSQLNTLLFSFYECLDYVVRDNMEDSSLSFIEQLLEHFVFSLLDKAVLEDGDVLSNSLLFPLFTNFLIGLKRDAEGKQAKLQRDKPKLTSSEKEFSTCVSDMCLAKMHLLRDKCLSADNSDPMHRFVPLLKSLMEANGKMPEVPSPKSVGFCPYPSENMEDFPLEDQRSFTHRRLSLFDPPLTEQEDIVELVVPVWIYCLEKSLGSHGKCYALQLYDLAYGNKFHGKVMGWLTCEGTKDFIGSCRVVLSNNMEYAKDMVTLMIKLMMVHSFSETLGCFDMLVMITQVVGWSNLWYVIEATRALKVHEKTRMGWLYGEACKEQCNLMAAALKAAIADKDVAAMDKVFTEASRLLMSSASSHPMSWILPRESTKAACKLMGRYITEDMTPNTEPEIVKRYCQFLLKFSPVCDQHMSTSCVYAWLTEPANKDAGEPRKAALALLERLVGSDVNKLDDSIQRSLELARCDPAHFSLIARVSSQIFDDSDGSFARRYGEKALKGRNPQDIIKYLSIPTMRGQLPPDEDVAVYAEYKLCDMQQLYLPYISDVLFLSSFLKNSQQELSSLHYTLHVQIAAVHTWMSYVVASNNLTDSDNDTLISSQTLIDLEHWLTDAVKNESTCVEIFNSSEDSDSQAGTRYSGRNVLDGLAVQCLASRLPSNSDVLLSSQATTYLSSFSTLSRAEFSCLSAVCQHLTTRDACELLEVVVACVISISPDAVDPSYTCLTGYLHLCTTLLDRFEEGDSRGQEHFLTVLDFLSYVRSHSPHQFISGQYPYMEKVDEDRLALNVSMMRFYGLLIKKYPSALNSKQWDVVLCSLDDWIGSEDCILPRVTSHHDGLYVSNVTSLLSIVGNLMKYTVPKQPLLYPSDFLSEWAELHALSIFNVLLPYYVSASAAVARESITVQQSFVLGCLSNALTHCPAACVKNHKLTTKLVPDCSPHMPVNYETALNHLVPLLLSPHTSVQSASFTLLNHLISALPAFDEESLEEDAEGRVPPTILMSLLDHCGPELLSLVGGARIGLDDPLHLLAGSDELCCVRAFLLMWKLILKYLQYSSTQQMAEYSCYLKQNHYTADLLLVLFNILPLKTPLPRDDTFTFAVQFDLAGVSDMEEVIGLACAVYYNLITVLPVAVRSWYTDIEKRANSLIDRFTAKHVSPRLCSEEIEQVKNSRELTNAANLTVKVLSSEREIVTKYTFEEFSIELVMVLPSNYPVGVTTVECSKRLGEPTEEWRKRMLQLKTFLTNQNGSVANAIDLWKRSLDKKFEGLEECYICFSVLHGTNLQLPKQRCKTCHKKFHSACLYKWFTTSQKSTCPLCRNLF